MLNSDVCGSYFALICIFRNEMIKCCVYFPFDIVDTGMSFSDVLTGN